MQGLTLVLYVNLGSLFILTHRPRPLHRPCTPYFVPEDLSPLSQLFKEPDLSTCQERSGRQHTMRDQILKLHSPPQIGLPGTPNGSHPILTGRWEVRESNQRKVDFLVRHKNEESIGPPLHKKPKKKKAMSHL